MAASLAVCLLLDGFSEPAAFINVDWAGDGSCSNTCGFKVRVSLTSGSNS